MTTGDTSDYLLGVVILAAGRSRRMGRPKMLLPWRGTTVIGFLVERWRSLGAAQLAVVTAAGDEALGAELARIGVQPNDRIGNPNPDLGMFSSVQCAARWGGWRTGLTHWAIALGDQPHLLAETLSAVLALSARNREAVCQPKFESHRRHPVIMPRAVFGKAAESGAADLRAFLEGHAAVYCAVNDPGLAVDLDRPEDYERAMRM